MNIKFKFILTFIFFLIIQWVAIAQISFHKFYHSSNALSFESVIQDPGNGLYLIGSAYDSLTPPTIDLILIKTDDFGEPEWCKSYRNINGTYGTNLCLTYDGGLFLAGELNNSGNWMQNDLLFIKVDSLGTLEWTLTIDQQGYERVLSVYQLPDSGFIIGACTNGINFQEKMYLIKVDKSGNKVWSRLYGSSNDVELVSMKPTNDGGFALLGASATTPKIILLKTDSLGLPQWDFMYDFVGSISTDAFDLLQMPDSGFAICARLIDNDRHSVIIRTNPVGMVVWSKFYKYFELARLERGNENEYYVSGLRNNNVVLMKMDTAGNIIWNKFYQGTGSFYPYDFKRLPDSTFIFLGNGYNTSSSGETLIKTGFEGDFGCSNPDSILVDSSFSPFFTTGITWSVPNDTSWIPIIFIDTAQIIALPGCLFTGIKTNEKENLFSDFVSIYPNPFTNVITFEFKENENNDKRIQIINILGQEVENFRTNENKLTISTKTWSPGIFQCIVSSTQSILLSKTILLSGR